MRRRFIPLFIVLAVLIGGIVVAQVPPDRCLVPSALRNPILQEFSGEQAFMLPWASEVGTWLSEAIFFRTGLTIQRSPSSPSHVSRDGKKSTWTSVRPYCLAMSRM